MIRFQFTLLTFCFAIMCMAQEKETQNFHIGLIYPISSNGIKALEYQNKVSLHAIGGMSGGELGLCLSGFGHITVGNQRGLQASGFGNIVNGETTGMLAAGFANISGNVQGMVAAGFANISTKVTGMQGAGFGNISTSIRGFQGAGFGNISGVVKGAQIAGFGNIAANVNGLQAAGFINIAEEVNGIQVAGFINIAKNVKGAQLAGFINIADSSDYPIGIINIIKNGEKFVEAYTDELNNVMLSFRSGGKVTYGFIGIGQNYHPQLKPDGQLNFEVGVGYQVNLIEHFRIRNEIFTSNFNVSISPTLLYHRSGIRLIADANLGRLHFFAGVGINYLLLDGEPLSSDLIIQSWQKGYNHHMIMLGLKGGVAFRI